MIKLLLHPSLHDYEYDIQENGPHFVFPKSLRDCKCYMNFAMVDDNCNLIILWIFTKK